MLKILSTNLAGPRKDIVGVGDYTKKEYDDRTEPVCKHEVGGNEVGNDEIEDEVEKNQKMSKSKKLSKSKKTVRSFNFLIPRAKLIFTKLRQAFVKALILYYFNLKHHIQIEINVSGYAINRVFS